MSAMHSWMYLTHRSQADTPTPVASRHSSLLGKARWIAIAFFLAKGLLWVALGLLAVHP